MLLIDTNINQVHLEISELKDESLNKDRCIVVSFCLVILHVSSVFCNLGESSVSHSSQYCLSDSHNHIQATLRIKNGPFVSEFRQERDIQHTSMTVRSDSSSRIQKANNSKTASKPTDKAYSETFGIQRHSLPKAKGIFH